jgi:hypothetical protein
MNYHWRLVVSRHNDLDCAPVLATWSDLSSHMHGVGGFARALAQAQRVFWTDIIRRCPGLLLAQVFVFRSIASTSPSSAFPAHAGTSGPLCSLNHDPCLRAGFDIKIPDPSWSRPSFINGLEFCFRNFLPISNTSTQVGKEFWAG